MAGVVAVVMHDFSVPLRIGLASFLERSRGEPDVFAPKRPAVANAIGELDAGTGVERRIVAGGGGIALSFCRVSAVSFSRGSLNTTKERPASLAAFT